MNNIPLYGYHILFIHSSVDGRLGYFRSLAIVNNDAVNSCLQFLYKYDFISLGYTPKSEIVGSYRNSIFNLLRTCQSVFSQQQYHFIFSPATNEYSDFSTF